MDQSKFSIFKSKNFLGILWFFLNCPFILAFARAHIVHARVYICVSTLRGHRGIDIIAWNMSYRYHSTYLSLFCFVKTFCYALKYAYLCIKNMLFAGLLGRCFFGGGLLHKNMKLKVIMCMAGICNNIWENISQKI